MTTSLGDNPFEYIMVKRENAGNHHFLLFQQCFYPMKDKFEVFSCICLQLLSIWTFAKILSSGDWEGPDTYCSVYS